MIYEEMDHVQAFENCVFEIRDWTSDSWDGHLTCTFGERRKGVLYMRGSRKSEWGFGKEGCVLGLIRFFACGLAVLSLFYCFCLCYTMNSFCNIRVMTTSRLLEGEFKSSLRRLFLLPSFHSSTDSAHHLSSPVAFSHQ